MEIIKSIFRICIFLLATNNILAADPVAQVLNDITSCKTLTEYKAFKQKYYVIRKTDHLERDFDFGYQQVVHDFDFTYSGSSYQSFQVFLLVKNDSIVFGKVNMIGDNWRKKVVEKDTLFSVNPLLLNQYLHDHNVLYNTALSLKKLQAYITSDYFYSFACGDGSTTGPKESAKVLSWIEFENKQALNKWLRSANCELQAYAINGLLSIKKNGGSLTSEEERIIQHLLDRNSLVVNCSGCLMGLVKPIQQLLHPLI
ncbi:hypothetical protein D3C78_943570 [compost metagenome]